MSRLETLTLPGPFHWSDGPVHILGVWFGPDLQMERNWSEVQAKVDAQVGTWFPRRLSLKSRTGACVVYVFPLILYCDWLYFLCLRHVGWRLNNPSSDYSGLAESRWFVDRSASNVRATGVWVCLIWRITGLLKYLQTRADPRRGTLCGDERRVGLFLASSLTQRLMVDVSRWPKHCLSASAQQPFVTFLGPVTFHGLGKSCIGSKWWVQLRTIFYGIGRQDRAS